MRISVQKYGVWKLKDEPGVLLREVVAIAAEKMSITLPEFIFKEFLEVEKTDVPSIIKDDGFRRSIVTSTGVSQTRS